MDIDKKKDFIIKFITQGVPLCKAYELTYCSSQEISVIDKDSAFIQELNEIKLELTLRSFDRYNRKVDKSERPSDDLRRLSTVMGVIDKEELDMPGDFNLTIIKQRGDIESKD